MDKKQDRKATAEYIFVWGFMYLLLAAGVVSLLYGVVKTVGYKRAEKIRVTFTEPIVSIEPGSRTDSNDYTKYFNKIGVAYVYNGEQRIYTFEEKGKTTSYRVGDPVTFTLTFSANGKVLTDNGPTFLIVAAAILPLPLIFILIMAMPNKKGRRQEENEKKQ